MKPGRTVSPREWSTSELGMFFVENRFEFLSHARRLCGSSAEAEEIVQDSLVRVLLACPELESRDHALSYFHRVIENLSVDINRRSGRQPLLVVLDDATIEVEAQTAFGSDFSDIIAAADDAAIVREAISLLSPAERAALVMREFEGRSTAEIARELEIKESAVKHTLARARAGLRRILSERVIDEKLGLTALDLLSISYRKVEKATEKASKLALSFILVMTAFLGFNFLAPGDFVTVEISDPAGRYIAGGESVTPSRKDSSNSFENEQLDLQEAIDTPNDVVNGKGNQDSFSINRDFEAFAGLDREGVPIGFTVADSSGNVGVLFPGQQKVSNTESGLVLASIVSTKSGATNVLMNQSVVLDAFGTSFVAEVSVGINGGWQPLLLSVVSTDVERLASGNYLLTAIMMVDSAVETSIKVSTGTSGIDLDSAPDFISTRVLLDSSKTRILAQTVLVSATSQGDGA